MTGADAPRPAAGDELVDVIDRDGQVVATVPRARMRAENLPHRSVFVLVRSSRGEVLLHRRSEAKDVWPGRWDLAVGGVVGAGETTDAAALRELAEEVGVTGVALERLGEGWYQDDDVRVLGTVYQTVHDGPFAFVDGEVEQAELVGLADLEELLAREPFVPDSVALVLPWLGLAGPAGCGEAQR